MDPYVSRTVSGCVIEPRLQDPEDSDLQIDRRLRNDTVRIGGGRIREHESDIVLSSYRVRCRAGAQLYCKVFEASGCAPLQNSLSETPPGLEKRP
jgi:hypothetical protein